MLKSIQIIFLHIILAKAIKLEYLEEFSVFL